MARQKTAKKSVQSGYPIAIWGAWALLLIIAIWWRNERLLYQDSAYGLFQIANLHFPIEHNRWGTAPLIFPAFATAWFGLPLSAVMATLSATGILLPALTSWIMWRISKDTQTYLLPLFLMTLTGPEWFFQGMVDMLPALCYCCLFFTFLLKADNWKSYQLYASVLFLFLAFNTHPGILPLVLFICFFHYAHIKNNVSLVAMFAIFLIAIAKKYFSANSSYENEVLGRASISNLQHIFDSWTWHYFLDTFLARLLIPAVLFAVGLIMLRKVNRPYSALYLPVVAGLGTFSIIVMFSNGDSHLMMEKSFAPIVLLLCIPILVLALRSPAWHKFYLFIALLFAAIGVWQRYESYQFYHLRLARMDALLQEKEVRDHEKIYYPASAFHAEEWRVTWALPYETVLRSEVNKQPSTTIKPYLNAPDTDLLHDSGMFYGADFAYKMKTDTMNQKYFHFSPGSKYHLIKESKEHKP